ncbi:hypothetical protein [Rhodobacter sp. 24-YEA-8]|uniref:hypothetical protein n=1 Tax=Rhodobacter sp. 24-YEA-8 TaxID=1884310 RepID=UPI000B80DA9C|nr:hypothetical protein [Rhodobacter sp. 24-YEA-8]
MQARAVSHPHALQLTEHVSGVLNVGHKVGSAANSTKLVAIIGLVDEKVRGESCGAHHAALGIAAAGAPVGGVKSPKRSAAKITLLSIRSGSTSMRRGKGITFGDQRDRTRDSWDAHGAFAGDKLAS